MQKLLAHGAKFKVGVLATALAGMAGVALQTGPANAQDQSGQLCAGPSSSSNGTWSFSAGTANFPSSNNSTCSLATTVNDGIPPSGGSVLPPDPSSAPVVSGDTDPIDNAFWAGGAGFNTVVAAYPNNLWSNGAGQEEELGASQLNLAGIGTFSCASGGNGTLASPSLSELVNNPASFSNGGNNPGVDMINTGVSASGVDNYAYVVWSAVFSNGVGQLTGTLYGATGYFTPHVGDLDPGATPVSVTGTIGVNCNDPSNGGVPNADTALTFSSMPPTTDQYNP